MSNKLPLVLLLEDDKIYAEQIKRALEGQNYCRVTIVSKASQARKEISPKYDCFVFDYDINGERVGISILTSAMKDGVIKVPPILISQYEPPLDVKKEFGFAAFIDKASETFMEKLIAEVEHVTDRKSVNMLTKMLNSVDCLKDDWADYNIDITYSPLQLQALVLNTKSVGDLLELANDGEVPEGCREWLAELLRDVFVKKQQRNMGTT